MKKLGLLATVIAVFVFTSCTSDPISKTQSPTSETQNKESAKKTNNSDWGIEDENTLKELTLYLGHLLKNESARQEMFNYANLTGNHGEIEFCLKELLNAMGNPVTGDASAIANGFFDSDHSDIFDIDSLAVFVNEHHVIIRAPYLAENFDVGIDSLTLSYYYPGMYDDIDDPDFTGETPGFKIDLIDPAPPESGDGFTMDVNDDYAIIAPSVVVMVLESSDIVHEWGWEYDDGGNDNNDPNPGVGPEVPLCTDLTGSEILEVNLPQFQLRGNIRRWPNANLISLWVATGEFETGSNGLPKLSANVNYVLNDYKVTRSQARHDDWMKANLSFIIHNWAFESQNMYLVWASVDHRYNVNHTVSVTAKTDDSPPELKTEYKIVQDDNKELLKGINFDKCAFLDDMHYQDDKGFGLHGGNYPIYGFQNVRFFFKVKKD